MLKIKLTTVNFGDNLILEVMVMNTKITKLIKSLEKAVHKQQKAYWNGQSPDDSVYLIALELESAGLGGVLIRPMNAIKPSWFCLASLSF